MRHRFFTPRHRFFTPLLCALTAVLSTAGDAAAQQNTVGVSPASVDARVKRGATYTQVYTLYNNTGTRLHFNCSVTDYWFDERNQRLTGRPGTLPRSASLWVQFTPAEVTIEPNSSATVKATVSVPQGAAGGYYTMPVFEALPADKPAVGAQGSSIATAAVGVRFRGLMMLTTVDASEYNVEINGGQVTPPTTSAELGLSLDVQNRGTVHARLRGAFALLDETGRLAGRGAVEEKRYLPGQRKPLNANWSGTLRPGRYTCIVTLSYDRLGAEPASLVYELPFEVK